MGRRHLAGACAVAGVLILAGPGWALLLAAALLYVSPAPHRLLVVAGRLRATAAAAWRWMSAGRRAVAVATMPAAVLCLALGMTLALGVGAGLAVGGLALGGVSLMLGWNT